MNPDERYKFFFNEINKWWEDIEFNEKDLLWKDKIPNDEYNSDMKIYQEALIKIAKYMDEHGSFTYKGKKYTDIFDLIHDSAMGIHLTAFEDNK